MEKLNSFRVEWKSFFETGRELQIKQLSHPLIANDEVITRDVPPADDNLMIEDDLVRDHSESVDEEKAELQEYNQLVINSVNENIGKPYSCENCEACFGTANGLWHHKKANMKESDILVKVAIIKQHN